MVSEQSAQGINQGNQGYNLAPTNTKKVNKTSAKSAATKHKIAG